MSYVERMLTDGDERFTFNADAPEFGPAVEALRQQFGSLDTTNWHSITSPQYSTVYNDDIVSVVFKVAPPYVDHLDPAAFSRKFFTRRGWVYDKVYTFTSPSANTLPIPTGGVALGLGRLVNVYGQPGDDDFEHFKCLYFMHRDHSAVEAWAERPLPSGKYSTFYAATFDTENGNKMLRMKTYCYDEQGPLSDWDVYWMRHAKKRGIDI